jgi:hypothetical protein
MKNITKKLATARVKLGQLKLKKSGKNAFAKFEYFELADFLPMINTINSELGLCTQFSMNETEATLKVIDTESDEVIEFRIPKVSAQMKADPIQILGGTITYLRRYLFLIAYEISENDSVDAVDNLSTTKKNLSNEEKFKLHWRSDPEQCKAFLNGRKLAQVTPEELADFLVVNYCDINFL